MSAMWGWIGPVEHGSPASETLARMGRPYDGRPGAMKCEEVGTGAALAILHGRAAPRWTRHAGLLLGVIGRPRLRDGADSVTNGEQFARDLADGYLRRGAGIVDRLSGGFAVAILEEHGRGGVLAVDRIGGRHRLAYRVGAGGVVFGSRADCVRDHPGIAADLDPQAIYDYLYFNVVPAPGSAWTGIHYLEPAHLLEYRDGEAAVRPYWAPRFRGERVASLRDQSEEFRERIRTAVATHCEPDDGSLGTFLSGGIDSSTVAGLVGDTTGRPARTFSIGFDADGFDEMEYARLAAKRFGTDQTEYYVTPADVLDALPRIASAYAEPFGNASAVPVYCCARVARQAGIDRMLGGDGGDELFAGNTRYATQKIFGFYDRVPGWLRRTIVDPVTLGIPGAERWTPTRKLRRYVEQARVPMPARMETYNHLERHGVSNVLTPDFLASVDPGHPGRLFHDVYHRADADDMVNRMLALDLKFTIADSDLPKVSEMCAVAGVDVEYPFLDDEVVEFSLRVRSNWKLKGLRLRWFVKQALAGHLPQEILTKEKHGFGLPFGLWMRDDRRLREFAHDHLADLGRRGMVRPEFVEDLLRRHRDEHATYYGVMIWVLLVLELWLRRNPAA